MNALTPLTLHTLAFNQGYRADLFMPASIVSAAHQAISEGSFKITTPPRPIFPTILTKTFGGPKAPKGTLQEYKRHIRDSARRVIWACEKSYCNINNNKPDRAKTFLASGIEMAQKLQDQGSIEGTALLPGLKLYFEPQLDPIALFDEAINLLQEELKLFESDVLNHIPADILKTEVHIIELLIRKADTLIDLAISKKDLVDYKRAKETYKQALALVHAALGQYKQSYQDACDSENHYLRADYPEGFPEKDRLMQAYYEYLETSISLLIKNRLGAYN